MSFRFSSLAAAGLALAVFGCVQQRPLEGSSGEAPKVAHTPGQFDRSVVLPTSDSLDRTKTVEAGKVVQLASTVPTKFRNADGTVNYEAMRATYGEPNTNIVLNPRAVNVSTTSSANSVSIEANRLVFARADADWLLTGHGKGDTLYCSRKCGASGFLRNVESIRTEGDSVIVETKQGVLTDVIHGGWIHGTQTIGVNLPAEERSKLIHDPHTSLINLGNCPSTANSDTVQVCYSADKSGDIWSDTFTKQILEPLPGGLGSLDVYASLKITLMYDINIEVGVGANLSLTDGVSVDPIFTISTLSISAEFQPTIQLGASLHVNESFSKDWTLVDIDAGPSFNLANLIDVDAEVFLSLKAHADASGEANVLMTASAADDLTIGASYSGNNNSSDSSSSSSGFSPIFKNKFTSPTYSLNGNAAIAAHASAGFQIALGLTVDGLGVSLGGPSLTAQGGAGAEFLGTASNAGGNCNLNISGEAYYAFSGNLDLNFGLPGFGFSYPYEFPTLNTTFPTGGYKNSISEKSAFCSTGNFDAGGQEECLPSDGGTKQFLCAKATPQCCPTAASAYACVNEGSDNNNCGACGYSCVEFAGAGSTCTNGMCSCTCPSDSSMPGAPCPSGGVAACF